LLVTSQESRVTSHESRVRSQESRVTSQESRGGKAVATNSERRAREGVEQEMEAQNELFATSDMLPPTPDT
jgi:hypothetical protein